MLIALLKTIRPHQWVKNVFVAAPLVFARRLGDPHDVVREGIAVLAFCLLSGAVYAFNDVRDVAADRAHPIKKNRPIAAGKLSERAALVAAAVMAVTALATMLALAPLAAVFAGAYFAQNVAYSIRLKHVAFVDVGLLASGFILRVLGGAAAIPVHASGWVLLCTGLLATFLGFGKRAHELAWAQKNQRTTETRAALAGYRLPHLRIALLVLGAVTVAAYAAYTLDPHTAEFFGTEKLVISVPFVALALVRFLMLALWFPRDDSPTEAMFRDPWFLLDLAGASAAILYAIYWS